MADADRTPPAAVCETVIEPPRRLSLDLGEVWRYRELLQLLAWRNALVRYKQSVIGVAWALVKPVVLMVVFTVIFKRIGRVNTNGIPGPIFYYTGLLPWLYFAGSLTGASGSLLSGRNMLTKVYFPRLILPVSYLFAGLIDFCLSFLVLGGLMVVYRGHVAISWGLLYLPLLLLLAMTMAFAFSLWFCSLAVKYRDVQHGLPFLVQVGMFLTLVVPASTVPERFQLLYWCNPMVTVVEGFRSILLVMPAEGQQAAAQPMWQGAVLGIGITLVVLVTGLFFFKRTERTFADVI